MAQVLKVSRSGYYAWRKRKPSQRKQENQQLLIAIQDVYDDSRRTYGSPRITRELNSQGIVTSENRVARLMKANSIVAVTKRKFKRTTDSRHSLPIAENLLQECPPVESIDQVWVSDITYIWTREGWLYLAIILDLFSRRIVGWSLKDRLKKELVVDALEMAHYSRRPTSGLIFHSDRGVQYASHEVRGQLEQYGFRQSMSGKGNCYDNAFAESFFHSFKTELVYQESFKTRAEAKTKSFEYLEVFYNRKRIHSALGYHSPIQFELIHHKHAA